MHLLFGERCCRCGAWRLDVFWVNFLELGCLGRPKGAWVDAKPSGPVFENCPNLDSFGFGFLLHWMVGEMENDSKTLPAEGQGKLASIWNCQLIVRPRLNSMLEEDTEAMRLGLQEVYGMRRSGVWHVELHQDAPGSFKMPSEKSRV